jgi:hypothetical protein
MSNLNVFSNQNLIPRNQKFVLDRKLVTIHSNDRDIKKWPLANHFEIQLPQTLYNVQSISLATTCFPGEFYVFSAYYENIILSFKLQPTKRFNDAQEDNENEIYIALKQNEFNDYNIIIDEGTYTTEQLSFEIYRKMNLAVERYLKSKNITATYDKFVVKYNVVNQKFYFGNSYDDFTLLCSKKELYEDCRQANLFDKYTNWGLYYFLGFLKNDVQAKGTSDPPQFLYNEDPEWIKPESPNGKVYVAVAPKIASISGEKVMYMEMQRFNSMDELVPFPQNTSNMYNNDYHGTVNAAFEKIPLSTFQETNYLDQTFNQGGTNLRNVSNYDRPIESIEKIRVLFRFHDGRLVNFQDTDFNFTLAFNCLKNEIPRELTLDIPAGYGLL